MHSDCTKYWFLERRQKSFKYQKFIFMKKSCIKILTGCFTSLLNLFHCNNTLCLVFHVSSVKGMTLMHSYCTKYWFLERRQKSFKYQKLISMKTSCIKTLLVLVIFDTCAASFFAFLLTALINKRSCVHHREALILVRTFFAFSYLLWQISC